MCTKDLLAQESKLHSDGSCLVRVCCAVRYGFLAARCVIIMEKRTFNAEAMLASSVTMSLICGMLKMEIMERLRSIVIRYAL